MLKICIVIPCYNEYNRLDEKSFLDFIYENNNEFDLLFVNDGSKDNTLQKLNEIASHYPSNIYCLNLEKNQGKAEAVRQGVIYANNKSKYSFIAYFDADLATPLSELLLMRKILVEKKNLRMIFASRVKRFGATVERKRIRHLFGKVLCTCASVILNLPVYDTQCGAKIISTSLIAAAFNEKFTTKWLFDIEILARLRNTYKETVLTIIYEHPVTRWKDISGSKLKIKHLLKVPLDLIKIYRKYNRS